MRGGSPSLLTLPPEPIVGIIQPTHSPQPCVDVGPGDALGSGGKKEATGSGERSCEEAARCPAFTSTCASGASQMPWAPRLCAPAWAAGGVLQLRGWVSQELGGEGGCDRVFCPTGSYVMGTGVQRQGLDSSYLS